MGPCTLTLTVPDRNGASTYKADYSFNVAGADQTDPKIDANIAPQHVTPAECVM